MTHSATLLTLDAEDLTVALAMRRVAALSFDPDSLERGLKDEINRNAWHNQA